MKFRKSAKRMLRLGVCSTTLVGLLVSTSAASGSGSVSVAVGDMDGDGDLDLAVASTGGCYVSIFLNDGDGTFAPRERYGT